MKYSFNGFLIIMISIEKKLFEYLIENLERIRK